MEFSYSYFISGLEIRCWLSCQISTSNMPCVPVTKTVKKLDLVDVESICETKRLRLVPNKLSNSTNTIWYLGSNSTLITTVRHAYLVSNVWHLVLVLKLDGFTRNHHWLLNNFKTEPLNTDNFGLWTLWQYGLWSFQTGVTRLDSFLPKNQHTQRKLLNFENWVNGKV